MPPVRAWVCVRARAVAAAAAVTVGAVGVLGGGCVAHPVGPARTFGKYEGKAATTAEAAVSAVQTAHLVADSAARGRAFGTYVEVTLSEQEDALNKLQGTFGSIQPPDKRADDLRKELDDLLATAVDDTAAVRIAARRGELSRLGDLAKPLQHDADALQDFQEHHGG